MKVQKRAGYLLIAAGVAIPALFLGIAIPAGDNSYSDSAAISGAFGFMLFVVGPSIVLLMAGFRKLLK